MSTTVKRSPALVLIIMLLSMVAGSTCMNKVAPVLGSMINEFGITHGQAGLLISIFVLSGIFLSIPMGMLINKYGIYKTGLFSLTAIIFGSVMGAVVGTYPLMLISRFIEGIGLMFLATIGPVSVSLSFSEAKRGTAMGILMCFMATGQIIAFNIAPVMAAAGSWRGFWWVTTVIAGIALVLWIFVIKGIDAQFELGNEEHKGSGAGLGEVLKNSGVLLVCAAFFAYMIANMGALNYLPTYFTEVASLSATKAGSLTSIAFIVGIPVGILGGVLADKWGSRKKPLALAMILFAALLIILPMFATKMPAVIIVLYGIVAMAEAGLCFTSISEVVSHSQASAAAAVLNTAQWLGAFLGSTVFGMLLDKAGWNTAFIVMGIIAAAGSAASFMNKRAK